MSSNNVAMIWSCSAENLNRYTHICRHLRTYHYTHMSANICTSTSVHMCTPVRLCMPTNVHARRHARFHACAHLTTQGLYICDHRLSLRSFDISVFHLNKNVSEAGCIPVFFGVIRVPASMSWHRHCAAKRQEAGPRPQMIGRSAYAIGYKYQHVRQHVSACL